MNDLKKSIKTDLMVIEEMPKDNYSFPIKHFIEFMKGKELSKITYPTALDYYNYQKSLALDSITAATFNSRLAALKNRLQYLLSLTPDNLRIDKRWAFNEKLKKLKPIKINKSIDFTLLPSVKNILDLTEKIKDSSPSISLIVRLGLATGLRISSVINIKFSDLTYYQDKGIVNIRISKIKNGKADNKNVSIELIDEIKNCLKGKKYLFETKNGKQIQRTYVSNRLEHYSKQYLNQSISYHSLRHIVASKCNEKGWDPVKIQHFLFHERIATTLELYCHSQASQGDVDELGLEG